MNDVEGNLGPLWERAPKSSGFRLVIPEPMEIVQWMRNRARYGGNITEEEQYREFDNNFINFIYGDTHRIDPDERVWSLDIVSPIISSLQLMMLAKYSEQSGEWVSMELIIHPSDNAVDNGLYWQISHRAASIAQALINHGLHATSYQTDDHINGIDIAFHSDQNAKLLLGYVTEEIARQDPEFDLESPYSFSITVDVRGVNVSALIQNLQNFQVACTLSIDALHDALELEPPNLLFEISSSTELQ